MIERFAHLVRGCAATGGVVSDQSAAQLYGMGDFAPHYLHLSCSATTPRIESIAIHRRVLRPDEIYDWGSFRITTPLRTILDLAESSISQGALNQAIGDGVAIGRVCGAEIHEVLIHQQARTGDRLRCALLAWQ
ncbi:hypothetical protein [Antrihabitans cavernicola]|uniref:Uncharacterized protein n=1 Tax=Antrihabitans cavernicola TaxID=2495913 RepID=A0A5A7SDN2_9NOCA|nr:hypothetical protein [Spelaeibacter cavernicola]KAA0022321.1 hypothetical protein FOY51_15225 [Spelaeibacter cavernicola]